MTLTAIIIAVIAAFLVFRFVKGVIKLVILGLIVAVLAFFVFNGVAS